MATYTTYPNGVSTVRTGRTNVNAPADAFMVAEYDAALRNLATTDKVQLFDLPEGVYVDDVFVEILTADAGGGGINVGDGAQAAGYGNYATISSTGKLAVAAGSATTYLYSNTTNAKVKPKLISAANDKTIYLAPTTAGWTTLKVRVTVKLVTI